MGKGDLAHRNLDCEKIGYDIVDQHIAVCQVIGNLNPHGPIGDVQRHQWKVKSGDHGASRRREPKRASWLSVLIGLCFGTYDRVVQVSTGAGHPTINDSYRHKIQDGGFANAIG